MKHPANAVSDVMAALQMEGQVRETVQAAEEPGRWIIRFESLPGTLIRSCLEVEILENAPYHPVGCVLRKVNVGRSVMERIMNELMDALDDEEPRWPGPLGQPPGQGEPPAQAS